MSEFQGKTALVTGASSGIGRVSALAFAKAGANVVVAARRIEKLNSVVEEIKKLGGKAIAVKCDVTEEKDNAAAVAAAVEAFGSVDIALLNSGVFSTDDKPIWETDSKLWQKNYQVNVFGVQYGLKHIMAQMVKQGKGGSIVVTSSAVGLRVSSVMQRSSGYMSSKWAITGLVGYVAVEGAKHNIRVNAVCPGVINTEMTGERAEAFAKATQVIPRPGEPEVIANAVLYLSSPKNDFVTGINLPVDGGLMLK